MVTFDDVKSVLESTSIMELEKEYTSRQQINILENNLKAKEVLTYFLDELLYLPRGLDNVNKLNSLLMFYLNSGNPKAKKILLDILNKYGYNPNSELLRAVQMTDLFFQKHINEDDYERAIGGLTISKSIISLKEKEAQIKSNQGVIKMTPLCESLGIKTIKDEERQGFCHNITSCILEENKKLYAGYYYIPLCLKGHIEHSVVIDLDKKEVLDFANNIIMPIKMWKRYFGGSTLFIDGKTYQKLIKQVKEELDIDLNVCLLEQVRRRKK